MPITFSQSPGFADVPNSAFAAEQYAVGRKLVAVSENAKFGFVVPEFFQAIYKNGDTVALPTSTVDGYQYQRDELIYQWAVHTTEDAAGWETGPGSLWFAQWFVNQSTGAVTSEEYYRTSGHDNGKSNDGYLLVTTIAIRRKNALVIATAPTFSDVADADLATDKAFIESTAQGLNRNAKFSVVNSEVIYMGEYGNGMTVATPVSPIDAYAYSYGEVVKFAVSWVWTPPYSAYATPINSGSGKPQNQLGRLEASVDGTGNVTTAVIYYDSGEIPTTDGRIAVFAFCSRSGVSSIGDATLFANVDPTALAAGQPLKTNVIKQVNSNIRESVLRPEYFDSGDKTNGDTVALPVSAVDGYTYSRDECVYLWEISDTGPETSGKIRIVIWYAWVEPSTGSVTFNRYALLDGGTSVSLVHAGKVRVTTIAIRSHTLAAATPGPDTSPGSISDGNSGDTINGV